MVPDLSGGRCCVGEGCWEGVWLLGMTGGLGRSAGGRLMATGLKVTGSNVTGGSERAELLREAGPGRGGKEGPRGLMGLGESEGLERLEGVEPEGATGGGWRCHC